MNSSVKGVRPSAQQPRLNTNWFKEQDGHPKHRTKKLHWASQCPRLNPVFKHFGRTSGESRTNEFLPTSTNRNDTKKIRLELQNTHEWLKRTYRRGLLQVVGAKTGSTSCRITGYTDVNLVRYFFTIMSYVTVPLWLQLHHFLKSGTD